MKGWNLNVKSEKLSVKDIVYYFIIVFKYVKTYPQSLQIYIITKIQG